VEAEAASAQGRSTRSANRSAGPRDAFVGPLLGCEPGVSEIQAAIFREGRDLGPDAAISRNSWRQVAVLQDAFSADCECTRECETPDSEAADPQSSVNRRLRRARGVDLEADDRVQV